MVSQWVNSIMTTSRDSSAGLGVFGQSSAACFRGSMLTHRCRREQFCQRGKLTLVSTLFSVHHTPNQAGSSRMLLSEGATVSSGATRESHYWPWSPTTLISHPNPQPKNIFTKAGSTKACSDYRPSRGLVLCESAPWTKAHSFSP